MKRKSLVILTAMMLVASIFTMTGCQEKDNSGDVANPIDVVISVSYPEESGIDSIKDVDFTIEDGASAVDAIQLYCNVENISTTMDTTTGEVTGIGGVSNGNYENRQWQCEVNGKSLDTLPSQTVLKNGDIIHWLYK